MISIINAAFIEHLIFVYTSMYNYLAHLT